MTKHDLARIRALSLLLLLLAVLWAFSRLPGRIESIYSSGLYPVIASILSRLTGWFGFSLAEVLLGLLLLGVLGYLAWRCRQWRSKAVRLPVVILRTLADTILAGLSITLVGYLLWGLNYGRPALAERLGWEPAEHQRESLRPLLEALSAEVVDLTNQDYRRCCSAMSEPPSRIELPRHELDRELNRALEQVFLRLSLKTPRLASPRTKPVFLSRLMDYLGLAGFYFPWTGEANFNREMPLLEAVHSIAHEKAHQFGFAREDEANFIGLLACLHSRRPYFRYSGYLFASRQLLSLLRRTDREAWQAISAGLEPGVLRDEAAIREFWKAFEGPSMEVAGAVNNAHLRLNRVPGGILSYGRSVELILQMAAQNGNSLQFDR